MGVWIEITVLSSDSKRADVTPCMGVWIEITLKSFKSSRTCVTPCMGVWIEIVRFICAPYSFTSLPVWECGLKLIRKFS